MTKVKISFPNPWPIKQQMPGHNIIPDYDFFINEDIKECDYWIVLDYLEKPETTKVCKENIILFALESKNVKKYSKKFVNQFSAVVGCQRIKHSNLINTLTTTFWYFKKEYDELVNLPMPQKTKLISIISSNKAFSSGHKQRLKFALTLKEHFGDRLDLYGRGIHDFQDKWDVLAPYKFSISIENGFYDDWSTEKFSDCLLSYTVPFYYGCPNIQKYYPNNPFIKIDINDIKGSIEIIEDAIKNDVLYDNKLESIKSARELYLKKYNFFNLLVNLIDNNLSKNNSEKESLTIYPENKMIKKVNQIITRLKNI